MNDFDNVVLEMMRDFGTQAVYVKASASEYNPATGEVAATSKELPVQVIIQDLTLQSNGLTTKYGTEIQAGDKQMFMRPPQKVKPGSTSLSVDIVNDSIRVGGVTYKIVTFKEINPTGSNAILFDLYVRR